MASGKIAAFALVLGVIFVSGLSAQTPERLPPADDNPPGYANPPLLYDIEPASYPGDLSQPVLDDYHTDDVLLNDESFVETDDGDIVPQQFSRITKAKDGFFQKLYVADTYIPRGGTDGLGTDDAEVALSLAAPLPNRRNPIIITPGITTQFLDGPSNTDLPARLYNPYLSLTWYPRFTSRLGAIVNITPSVFSDFEKWDSSAIRLPGRILLRYTLAQYEREFVIGAVYLDRDDIPWLPAAGVIWTPNPYVTYELVIPRPRILFMINEQENHEDWAYVAGEFSGNSWSIQRVPSFQQDVVTFTDYRVIVGIERRKNGGAGLRVEAGYVFGRSFEYQSTGQQFDPTDSFMVRGSVAF